jgi:hypothetical protein
MKHEATIAVALAALLLPTVYLAAYVGMLRSGESHIGEVIPGTGRYELLPIYRWENDTVRKFFWPAHQVDRRIRPDRWSAELTISE